MQAFVVRKMHLHDNTLQALFLPEASDYIGGSAAETVSLAPQLSQSPFVNGLKAAARSHSLAVCVGIHEPSDDGTKVKNCLIWINESGDISHKYQKIHLFDVDIEHGPRLQESRYGASFLQSFLNSTQLGRGRDFANASFPNSHWIGRHVDLLRRSYCPIMR